MSTFPTALISEFAHYLHSFHPVDNEISLRLQQSAKQYHVPEIWISPDEARALQWIIKATKSKRVLEIGTLIGYSAMMMAYALPEDGKLITLEKESQFADIAKSFWNEAGLAKKIQVIVGDATETVPKILETEQPFDFVFIDADKRNYHRYFEYAFQITHPNGIIALDNAFAFGQIYKDYPENASVKYIQECNKKIINDKRVFSVLLPVGDGLLLCTKT